MEKKFFLLSDQVIHWNIVPATNQKNIFMETWGNDSTKKILTYLKAYFSKINDQVDWSFLEADYTTIDPALITPCDNSFNHAFATWQQYHEGKNKVWRIQEIVHGGKALQPEFQWQAPADTGEVDLFIFQDWGLDIRNRRYPGLADYLQEKWVIFRAYTPLFEGGLWQEFRKGMGSKDILVLRAADLRKMNTSISKGLSWEQTLQDLINEIYFKRNISLYPLRSIEYIVISFGCTGTLLIHNPDAADAMDPEFRFYFDSMMVEGYWENTHPGYLPGDLELLIGLLSKEILYPEMGDDIRMDRAIRAHLLARRALVTHGGNVGESSLALEVLPGELDKVYSAKPTADFKPVSLDYNLFKSLFGDGLAPRRSWSFLSMTKWDLYSLARQIAIRDPMKALHGWNIPIAKYNFLLTVDRKEIEFLHHLKSLITEYLQNRSSQPLSIAVFGPPGSGKSFSIKQLAKALDLPDYEVKDITFNLSQFNEESPTDLYQAFHAVRDISLSGKIPLVFWDEFDSKALAWLRYFLAPMQDGEFQEGQLTHNIGKSIFVFAGGTCSCMEEFEEKAHLAKKEKGPDFLSRIKGYLNVMGPNPLIPYCGEVSQLQDSSAEISQTSSSRNTDPEYIIRRAILINSLLQIGYKQLFKDGILQIDDGVLNAFLLVPRYKHGTRSLETIFKTSQLFGKTKYHRSDLPPESQLNLHVDGQQFFELVTQEPVILDGGEAFYHLVNEITFDEHVVEKMAVGIHSIYSLAFSIPAGRDPLSITRQEFLDQLSKIKELPESMPHDEVSQNYHNARKIPEKLAAVGFSIVPFGVNLPAIELNAKEREEISRMEHIRWVRHHIDAGWSYAPKKDKLARLHDALVPWDESEIQNMELVYGKKYAAKMGTAKSAILSEHYRDLDRVITMAIPWILETVGYKIVRRKQDGGAWR
jgi:hypothetical protein